MATDMRFTCLLGWDGEARVVHARGEIDAFTAASLGQSLRTAIKDNRGQIVLDLSEVTFIDGSGLRALERCRRVCQEKGLSFGLLQPAPHIRRLIELVGLDRVLPVFDSTPEEHDGTSARGASDP